MAHFRPGRRPADVRPTPLFASRVFGFDTLDRECLGIHIIDLAPIERFSVGKSCRKGSDDRLVLSAQSECFHSSS